MRDSIYVLLVGWLPSWKQERRQKYGEVHFVYEMAPYKVCGH